MINEQKHKTLLKRVAFHAPKKSPNHLRGKEKHVQGSNRLRVQESSSTTGLDYFA